MSIESSTPGLDVNGLRQCLRIAFGSLLGFLLNEWMNWNYGVFFTVFPMVLLGIVPMLKAPIIIQFLAGAVFNCIEVILVVGLLYDMPIIMLGLAFALFYMRFGLMARGPMLFLFGAHGVLSTGIMYHFASYAQFDLFDLTASYLVASLLTVAIALLMYQLFPDVEPRRPPSPPAKSASQRRHETLMGAITVTVTLAVFLVFDLLDSLSAQASIILILFALNYPGVRLSARNRLVGTLLGSALALAIQLLLYTYSTNLLLVSVLYWLGLMLFARAHVLGSGAASVGFAGLTSMGIIFSQYLTPSQDIVYNTVYRLTSVGVALVIGILFITGVHWLLNRFETTRSDFA
jgi:hypothetical protein